MNRRCMNCMNVFMVPEGYENDNNCCPFCGFIENTPPANQNYLPTWTKLNNRYVIGTVIGAGGFGITYKAWDETFEKLVAIKEFFPRGLVSRTDATTMSVYSGEETSFEHGKTRFLKEARNLSKLNTNPRVVTVLDFFEANGTAYLVMEYLDGCTLKEYVKLTGGTLPIEMVMTMAESMCDVLEDIHAIGMIHRDISPDNIFICQDFSYKLIDFGSSKLSATDTELSSTILLKHGYAPFEQYSKSGLVGPWTDIYSLSATMYKLLTGVLPPEAIDRISSDNLIPPIVRNHQIPKYFSDAIMRGLSVKIEDRYQNASDFKKALFEKAVWSDVPYDSGNAATQSEQPDSGGVKQTGLLSEANIMGYVSRDDYSDLDEEKRSYMYSYALMLYNLENKRAGLNKRYTLTANDVVLAEGVDERKPVTNFYMANLIIRFLLKHRWEPAVREFGMGPQDPVETKSQNRTENQNRTQNQNRTSYQRSNGMAVGDVSDYRRLREQVKEREKNEAYSPEGEDEDEYKIGTATIVLGLGFLIFFIVAALS